MSQTMTQIRDTCTDENGNVTHRWAIAVDGQVIAELHADIDTAEIVWVWTHKEHRGEGHATALYAAASAEMTIYHAPASHRTPDGDRFAARTGGPVMPDCTTCCADLND